MIISRIFLTVVLIPPALALAGVYMLVDARRWAACVLRGCQRPHLTGP